MVAVVVVAAIVTAGVTSVSRVAGMAMALVVTMALVVLARGGIVVALVGLVDLIGVRTLTVLVVGHATTIPPRGIDARGMPSCSGGRGGLRDGVGSLAQGPPTG